MAVRRPPRRTTAPAIESLIAPLVGRTFDLRRAYEANLRLLTELQHEIDIVRSGETPFPRRRQGLENVEHHFQAIAKSSHDADDLLKKVRAEFDTIHHQAHEIEQEQRAR